MRAEFILDLYEDLKRVQVPGVIDEELRILIEDISKFMREDLQDFEINQQAPVSGIIDKIVKRNRI